MNQTNQTNRDTTLATICSKKMKNQMHWFYFVLVLLACGKTTMATFWRVPSPGPRSMHCLVAYDSTSALLFGGENAQSLPQNDLHLYDLKHNRWTSVVTFGYGPSPRVFSTCFAVNATTVYVYGGDTTDDYYQSSFVLTDMYALDIPSLTWTAQPSSPVPQGSAAGAYLDDGGGGYLVVFGGQPSYEGLSAYTADPCTNVTMLFSVTDNQWYPWDGINGPSPRCFASMAAIGDKAYMTGGFTTSLLPTDSLAMDMWQFDIATMTWTNLGTSGSSVPSARGYGIMVSNPATMNLYYLGGVDFGGSNFAQVYAFNAQPLNRTWNYAGSLSSSILEFSGFMYQDTIWYYGGWTGTTTSADLWSFQVETQQLLHLSAVDDTLSLSIKRTQYGGTLYNSTFWVFGGMMGTTATLNDMVTLDLVTLTWTNQLQSGTIPSPRFSHTFVTIRDVGILFGGASFDFQQNFNDVYSFSFATGQWTQLSIANSSTNGPAVREAHSASVWQENKMVIFGGENCCFNFNDVWVLDLDSVSWYPIIPTTNGSSSPPARWSHCATVVGDMLYIFGGSPAFNDIWSLDLVQAVWTQLFTVTNNPPAVNSAASVLVGMQWYINGGQNILGQTIADTWTFDLNKYTWTQIKTLDANTPAPQAVMQHQGVASPFGDQLIFWGPGTPQFQTQLLSPGFHQITISETTGSDVACQLNEQQQPCKTFAFALSRFAGSSDFEFTISADLVNTFTIDSSQKIHSFTVTVPLQIQGNGPNLVLDCQGTICFQLLNIVSNPFILSNVNLVNGYSNLNGGAIMATNSLLLLQSVTVQNNRAQQGGAIFLSGSSLTLENVVFFNNSATDSGGAIFADQQSTLIAQSAEFIRNQAGLVGGAICATSTSLFLTDTLFSNNQVYVAVSSAVTESTFIAGGAISATNCNMQLAFSTFESNSIHLSFSEAITYGGAICLYTTSLSSTATTFNDNFAMYGGGICMLSVQTFAATILSSVLQPSQLVLIGTNFTSNVALVSGGALYTMEAQWIQVNQCDFTNNTSGQGGGAVFLSLVSATFNGSTFSSNTCQQGNGGAISLSSAPAILSDCVFTLNSSPNGGGGGVYFAASTGTSSQIAASVSPVVLGTHFTDSNTAAFGSQIASDPSLLFISSPKTLLVLDKQNSGTVVNRIQVSVADAQQQIILNVANVYVSINPLEYFAGGVTLQLSNGSATFSALIIQAPPNSTIVSYFSAIFPTGVLTTPPFVITTAPCYPGTFLDTTQQVCQPCPPGSTTFTLMQTVCTYQVSSSTRLNVWITAAVGILFIGACLGFILHISARTPVGKISLQHHWIDVMVSGSLVVLCITSILHVSDPSDWVCNLRVWLTALPVVWILAILSYKANRVFGLSQVRKKPDDRATTKPENPTQWIVNMMAVEMAFLAILSGVSLTTPTVNLDSTTRILIPSCSTGVGYWNWVTIQLLFLFPFFVAGLGIVLKSRKLLDRFSDADSIRNGLALFNVASLVFVLVDLINASQPISTGGYNRAIGQIVASVVFNVLFYVPKWLVVRKKKAAGDFAMLLGNVHHSPANNNKKKKSQKGGLSSF